MEIANERLAQCEGGPWASQQTASDAGLLGGNINPTPGEISIVDQGVLFLDELPEIKRSALETNRQPLEDGRVPISRAADTLTFPAQLAMSDLWLSARAYNRILKVGQTNGRPSSPLKNR